MNNTSPRSTLNSEFQSALKAMEDSFHTGLISTYSPDLCFAPASALAREWLTDRHLDFDQFPVRDNDSTVGVLLRDDRFDSSARVRDVMRPLSEEIIVSTDLPISSLIAQLRTNHFRLVLRGSKLDGLVTQSDLLKLPVRAVLYGFVSHLEHCMRAVIRATSPWPQWLTALTPPRRARIENKHHQLQASKFEPDPLEFTFFSDVVPILQTRYGNDFVADMERIRHLRNDIAHGKTYVTSPASVIEFVDRFTLLRGWIDRLSQELR